MQASEISKNTFSYRTPPVAASVKIPTRIIKLKISKSFDLFALIIRGWISWFAWMAKYVFVHTLNIGQWRNWGGALGAIAPPSRKNLLFLKEDKNKNILFLPHFNFLPCKRKILLRVHFTKSVHRGWKNNS